MNITIQSPFSKKLYLFFEIDFPLLQCSQMGQALWNDHLLDEQERAKQKGTNINDSISNEMAPRYRLTTSYKIDWNYSRCDCQEDIPVGNRVLISGWICSLCAHDREREIKW